MKALQQRWDAWLKRREEKRALLELGKGLPTPAHDEKLQKLEGMLALSMARDRADYAAVPAWARPAVVVRGLFDRAVLRALAHGARQERTAARLRLAAEGLPDAKGPQAEAARAASKAAADAASGLAPLPAAVREAGHFSQFVWKEARAQLVPRIPALIGLGVGFWIAQTFTDSELSATLHSWGFGVGPRHAVRSETLHAMSFWLPLLAAALTSYAGSRLSALIRSRYAPEPAAPTSPPC